MSVRFWANSSKPQNWRLITALCILAGSEQAFMVHESKLWQRVPFEQTMSPLMKLGNVKLDYVEATNVITLMSGWIVVIFDLLSRGVWT